MEATNRPVAPSFARGRTIAPEMKQIDCGGCISRAEYAPITQADNQPRRARMEYVTEDWVYWLAGVLTLVWIWSELGGKS